jgi:LmbE family N-acetylglucosaminyl deacetylase
MTVLGPAAPPVQPRVTGAPGLPSWRRPLAVVAHPDDESFGLGAVLSGFVTEKATPSVLCLTRGEASTLHGVEGDLHSIRAAELTAAATLLGLARVDLRDHPDGDLATTSPLTLANAVVDTARATRSDGFLVFDVTGVTGHPDHTAATQAALAAADVLDLPVLAWTLPQEIAVTLNTELGTSFLGRPAERIDLHVRVDRRRQILAVHAHPSQAVPGSALWRRLELLGDTEHLRWLRHPDR